ncbi:chromate transporter [Ruminococcaceae bacterium OttesenSCG-928-L11]|nr:chromate transporter [Ruminococcaceae bacterium OttesenSCG-928-L11]
MSLLQLFLRFFYVGLFTVGGGLASIPLMLQTIVDAGLITEDMFYNMLGISQSTPGPIGVNLATYIGFGEYGVIGGIVTTLGIILPCFFISYLVSRAFQKFSETKAVKASFYGIRAVVTGMIATAAFGVLKITVLQWDVFQASGQWLSLVNWRALGIFAVVFVLLLRFKKHPVLYIALGGLAGLVLL